jgi:hypothetical protein
MKEEDLTKIIHDGETAQELINNTAFHKVVSELAGIYQDEWINTTPDQSKEREYLWQRNQTLLDLKRHLSLQIERKNQAMSMIP